MRLITIILGISLFLVVLNCNLNSNSSHTEKNYLDTIKTGSELQHLIDEEQVFNLLKFISLTDSLLKTITKGYINLSFKRYNATDSLGDQSDYYFDPGDDNQQLKFWIKFSNFENITSLDSAFNQLKQNSKDENESDGKYTPGLTYSNDFVVKTNKEIIWLNTGCPYSYFNHNKIKHFLLQSLTIDKIRDSINCECGKPKCL